MGGIASLYPGAEGTRRTTGCSAFSCRRRDADCQSVAATQRAILRELRIRFYQPKTVKNCRTALTGLFRWFNAQPQLLTREDVREYLEVLVDGGASASWVSIHRSGIRTAFDKMCGRRQVMLPVSFEPLLRHIANTFQAEDYVFPATSAGRHTPEFYQKLLP